MGKKKLPSNINVYGQNYKLAVALVNTRHEGKVKNISLIYEDQTVELAGGEEFMTLYVPACMLERKS